VNRHASRLNDTSFAGNEAKIIALAEECGEIARKDVGAALSVSQSMAIRLLRALVYKGSSV
jgi:DNA-binding MurR/RpiR family transcriptional regulator